jgi:WD40 repeat protein
VTQYFYAHDDLITGMMFKDDILITCSLDYLIKFWDIKSGQVREPSKILYEHEGPIFSADLHPSLDEMASVD